MKSTLLAICFCAVIGLSCGNRVACSTPKVAEVSLILSEALTSYANDQSVANCLAYKAALNEYLGVVEDCSFVNDQEVADARQKLEDLSCN